MGLVLKLNGKPKCVAFIASLSALEASNVPMKRLPAAIGIFTMSASELVRRVVNLTQFLCSSPSEVGTVGYSSQLALPLLILKPGFPVAQLRSSFPSTLSYQTKYLLSLLNL